MSQDSGFAPSTVPTVPTVPTISITYVTTVGAGGTETVNVQAGTTAADLFSQKNPGRSPGDFSITVNRVQPRGDQILVNGDKFVVAPRNAAGAK